MPELDPACLFRTVPARAASSMAASKLQERRFLSEGGLAQASCLRLSPWISNHVVWCCGTGSLMWPRKTEICIH